MEKWNNEWNSCKDKLCNMNFNDLINSPIKKNKEPMVEINKNKINIIDQNELNNNLSQNKPDDLTRGITNFLYNYTDRPLQSTSYQNYSINPVNNQIFRNEQVERLDNINMNNAIESNVTIKLTNNNNKEIKPIDCLTFNQKEQDILNNGLCSFREIVKEDDYVSQVDTMIKNSRIKITPENLEETNLFKILCENKDQLFNLINQLGNLNQGDLKSDIENEEVNKYYYEFLKWLYSILNNRKVSMFYSQNDSSALLTILNLLSEEEKNKNELIKKIAFYIKIYFIALCNLSLNEEKIDRYDTFFKMMINVAKQTIFLSSNFNDMINNINGIKNSFNQFTLINGNYLDWFKQIIERINDLQSSGNLTIQNVENINQNLNSLSNRVINDSINLSKYMEYQSTFVQEFENYKNLLEMIINTKDINKGVEVFNEVYTSVKNLKNSGFPDVQKNILENCFKNLASNIYYVINCLKDKQEIDIEKVVKDVNKSTNEINSLKKEFDKLKESYNELKVQYNKLNENITSVKKQFETSTHGLSDEIKKIKINYEDLVKKVIEMNEQIGSMIYGMTKLKGLVSNNSKSISEFNKDLDDLKLRVKNTESLINEHTNKLNNHDEKIKELENYKIKWTESINKLEDLENRINKMNIKTNDFDESDNSLPFNKHGNKFGIDYDFKNEIQKDNKKFISIETNNLTNDYFDDIICHFNDIQTDKYHLSIENKETKDLNDRLKTIHLLQYIIDVCNQLLKFNWKKKLPIQKIQFNATKLINEVLSSNPEPGDLKELYDNFSTTVKGLKLECNNVTLIKQKKINFDDSNKNKIKTVKDLKNNKNKSNEKGDIVYVKEISKMSDNL